MRQWSGHAKSKCPNLWECEISHLPAVVTHDILWLTDYEKFLPIAHFFLVHFSLFWNRALHTIITWALFTKLLNPELALWHSGLTTCKASSPYGPGLHPSCCSSDQLPTNAPGAATEESSTAWAVPPWRNSGAAPGSCLLAGLVLAIVAFG